MASAVAVQTSPAVLQRVRPLFASRGRAVNQVKPALEAAFASVASGPPSPPPLRSGCRWPGFICGGGGASCFSGRGRGLRSSRASRAASESPTVARSGSDAGTEPLAATPSDRDWELRVHRISGDGRCLFRAIAHSDALASRRGQGPTLTVAEEAEAADQLRACVVAELKRRADDVAPFVDEDYGAYLRRMARPHTWGGEPEISVAVHCIQRPIQVFLRSGVGVVKGTYYGEEYAGKGGEVEPAMILFDGKGHYDMLYYG